LLFKAEALIRFSLEKAGLRGRLHERRAHNIVGKRCPTEKMEKQLEQQLAHRTALVN
jgi:RNA-binding protein YhbY